jgi:putative FmdB family regulatory protein
MPTYEYACKSCGEHLEVVQSFKDDALTICPRCEGPLRKVFGSIGISFKGSGFYRTDSRSGAGSTTKGIGKSDSASELGDRRPTSTDAGTGASGGSETTRREPAPAAGGASGGATTPAAAAS